MRKLSKVYTPSSEDLVRAEVVRLRSRPCTGAEAVRSGGRAVAAAEQASAGVPDEDWLGSAWGALYVASGVGSEYSFETARVGEPSTWRPARLGEPSPFDSSTQISPPSPRYHFLLRLNFLPFLDN
ncbi:dynamin-2A isoform X1 [Iris pallida]|uniref:Dynamin-2A isoform X1 n=1 Tax=Iris pallida TaxID=29817 RepID=A0AAX6EEP2_IRIPA|nr:dynamin-2A isoform X1 [Iris pallida]